jgi:hypothetical protein
MDEMVAGLEAFRMIPPSANKVEWCMFGSAFDASLLSTCMSPASRAMNRRDLELCTPRTACFVLVPKLLQQSLGDMQSLGYD